MSGPIELLVQSGNNSTWHQFTTWVTSGSSWTGDDAHKGALQLLGQHVWISALSLVIAIAIGVPAAMVLARWRQGGTVVTVFANAMRAIPIVGVMLILAVGPLGIGTSPAIVALVIFAIPPVLTSSFTGIREVDREATDAAIGMGMSPFQVSLRVQLPLAIPLIATGIRLAAVQVWATATIAAIIGSGGLGQLIVQGYAIQAYGEVYGGVAIAVVTSIFLDFALSRLELTLRKRFGGEVKLRSRRRIGAAVSA